MGPRRTNVVLLANGTFPRRGSSAWNLLAAARTVVACDGAAIAFRRRFGRAPEFTVGDLDSLPAHAAARFAAVRVPDQETNDLEKALDFCAARGWSAPVVVGACGRREDHMLGNVFRALARGITVIADFGTFHPVCGRRTFRPPVGSAVSVFAPDPATRMSSKGLAWPLDGVRFANLFCATLNRTTSAQVTVESDRLVFVYIAFSSSHPAEDGKIPVSTR